MRGRTGAASVAALALLLLCAGPLAAETFDYLAIEANTGSSSGGHAAVCFAADCFHFQHADGGFLRLQRESREQIDYAYRLIGNRSIHLIRVQVDRTSWKRLQAAFVDRLHREQSHFDVLASLDEDVALLEALLEAGEGGTPALPVDVPASGYFLADDGAPAVSAAGNADESSAIDRSMARVREELAAVAPAEDDEPADPRAGELAPVRRGVARRYRDLLARLTALLVMRDRMELQPRSLVELPRELTARERLVWQAREARLAEAVERLPRSGRPDWGVAWLIARARQEATARAVASGRMVVLDGFDESPQRVDAETVRRYSVELTEVERERGEELAQLRHELEESEGEAAFSRMEAAANRWLELQHALATGEAMRVWSEPALPKRSAHRADWPRPELSSEVLHRELGRARQRERRYRQQMLGLYAYDLVRHNCVTELFSLIDAAAVADRRPAPSTGLEFVPRFSPSAMSRRFGVESETTIPSYRRLALEAMYRTENPLQVALRESNRWTARSFAGNRGEPFVFFTDDLVWPRPLLGAANLVAGAAVTAAGVLSLPLDAGERLQGGIEAMVFSLPELVWVNIRKGSLLFAPQSWLSDRESRGFCDGPSTCSS